MEEARQAGLFVAAHAHARRGANDAVRAGVRSIEHGTYLDDETLALMKERGTFFVPTLAIMSPLGDPHGDDANSIALQVRTHHMQGVVRGAVKRARALGIPIAAATDGSYGDGEDSARVRVADDIEALIGAGLTPMEAIVAATRTGARLLGIDSRTGRVAVGSRGRPARRGSRPADGPHDTLRTDAGGERRQGSSEPPRLKASSGSGRRAAPARAATAACASSSTT